MGIPSVAISLAAWEPSEFAPAARVAHALLEQLLGKTPPPGTLFNVNVPDLPYESLRGVRVTRLGKRVYPDVILAQRDPRGKQCYWIGGERPTWQETPEADYTAVQEGFVSVTPLHLDLTHHGMLNTVRGWGLGLRGVEEDRSTGGRG